MTTSNVPSADDGPRDRMQKRDVKHHTGAAAFMARVDNIGKRRFVHEDAEAEAEWDRMAHDGSDDNEEDK